MATSVEKLALAVLFLGLMAPTAAAIADEMAVLPKPEATQWGPAPPTLPKGAKLAVLYGDPSKPDELMSMLDTFKVMFEVVEPKQGG